MNRAKFFSGASIVIALMALLGAIVETWDFVTTHDANAIAAKAAFLQDRPESVCWSSPWSPPRSTGCVLWRSMRRKRAP